MMCISMPAQRYLFLRSLADRALAGILLLLAFPVLATVAIAVRATMGSPVIFKQVRVGQHGRRFQILKFRSMVADAEYLGGGYMPDELNLVPPVGRFIRRTSLDELPQLVNIVRGEMAFIGPRPALVDQYERYTSEQLGRVRVPQGVTGLAQVRYRNHAPWSARINADLEYVDSLGLRTDFQILLATVRKVLRSEGVLLNQTSADVDDLNPRPRVD